MTPLTPHNGRTVWAPVGTAGGVVYSIVAPAVSIFTQTAGSLIYDGAIRGAAVPAVLYVWNGVAWVGDSFETVPTTESFFVHLEYQDPKTNRTSEKLRDVVTNYLISLGVSSPDPKMVDAIIQKIGDTLQQMNIEMGKTAATPASTPATATTTGALK